MSNSPYRHNALAKYSKLVKATVSGDLEAVKELLKDESIDIQTLIPADEDDLTSAVALAIDTSSDDMIQAFLSSPKMDFQRSVGKFGIEAVQCWEEMDFSVEKAWPCFNVINYAIYKENITLVEKLIKERRCNWTGEDFVIAAHICIKQKQVQKFMDLIAIPNAQTITNLSNKFKIEILNIFKYFEADIDDIFDICFPAIEEDYGY